MDVADLKPAMLRADRLAAWDDESVANLKPKECALCREDKHALHPVRLLDGCREATAPLVKWRRSNDVLGRVCRVAFLHSGLALPLPFAASQPQCSPSAAPSEGGVVGIPRGGKRKEKQESYRSAGSWLLETPSIIIS